MIDSLVENAPLFHLLGDEPRAVVGLRLWPAAGPVGAKVLIESPLGPEIVDAEDCFHVEQACCFEAVRRTQVSLEAHLRRNSGLMDRCAVLAESQWAVTAVHEAKGKG